jgi:hypothetical protein
MWRSGAAILAAVILMAAPGAAAKPIAGTAANTGGFRTGPDGTVTHQPTGTRFPAAADGFVRTSTQSLDPTGKYPVVTYERGTGARKSVARIALVQIDDMSALEHYAAMAPTIGTHFGDLHFDHIKPISDGPLALPGVAPRNAWQGRFSAMRGRQKYVLSLSTLDMGRWGGRVTAAYPQADAVDVRKRLNALVGRIRATGPRHVHAGS